MAETKGDQILVEVRDLADLQIPLTRTSRLRYTCLSVSDQVIALGSNTGGIYLFSKTDCKLLQVAFAEKETAAVTQLLISPNEKFVAFTVSSGKVHIIDLKLDTRTKSETLRSVTDLGGAIVTCFRWDTACTKLFIGDDMGKVSMIPVSTSKAKNLFSIPMEVIMKLESAVVQIDKAEDKLLVSTMTRCYLCDTTKQQYTQIGKKPRDGQYGACFLSQGSTTSMIYCARPGSRIWEVDMEGSVLNTHQFKQLLAVSPLSVLDKNRKFTFPDEAKDYPGQSVAFPKLKIIHNTFLLTWNSTSIYILDPVNVKLVLWTDRYNSIKDISCVNDEIYVFLQTMQVHCLSLMPVSKAIHLCMEESKIETVARLCCFYGNILHKKHQRKHLRVPDLYKIYNALVVNEMHELGAAVLSSIKDIELKVAMETDTDTSDSNRSRSSSVLSATSENLSSVNENLHISSCDRLEKGRIDDKVNQAETRSNDVLCKADGDLNIDSQKCEIDIVNHGAVIMESKLDSLEIDGPDFEIPLNNQSAILPVHSKCHDNLDELDGAQISENIDVVSEQTVLVRDNIDMQHNVGMNLVNSKNEVQREFALNNEQSNTDEAVKDGESDVFIKGGTHWNLNDIERGEPDGNSYRDEYEEHKDKLQKAGNQKFLHELDQSSLTITKPCSNETESAGNSVQGNVDDKTGDTNAGLDTDISSLRGDKPWKSHSPSPVAVKDIPNDVLDDEDGFMIDNRKSFGPRRMSLTSLSSFSSAEVTMDSSTDPSEQIAIQVKRRTSLKTKKKKRKSTSDVKGSSTKETAGSPTSIGSGKGLLQDLSVASIDSVGDGDNISQSSDGNMAADSSLKDAGSIPEEQPIAIIGTPIEEYGGSGEFQQSSDWGVSGEFSASESTFLQSWDKSKEELSVSPSSAPKAAFLKFKDKMQNQVTTKTKKLIQNIKDKNLLTKAKEIAENFSQGPEMSLVTGGYIDTDQFDNFGDPPGNRSLDKDVKFKAEDTYPEAHSPLTPVQDLTELQEVTEHVKTQLEDPEAVVDLDRVYMLLSDWVNVLNRTFHKFHVRKFAPSVCEDESSMDTGNAFEKSECNETEKTPNSDLDVQSGIVRGSANCESSSEYSNAQDAKNSDMDLEMASSNFEKILSDRDFCYLTDPLNLPPVISKTVSQLVHACFEIDCHGNILAYQKLQLEKTQFDAFKISNDTSVHGENSDSAQNVFYDSKKNIDISEEIVTKENHSIDGTTEKEKATEIFLTDMEAHGCDDEIIVQQATVGDTESDKGNPKGHSSADMEADGCDNTVMVQHSEVKAESSSSTSLRNISSSSSPMNFFIRLYYPYLHVHRIEKGSLQYPEWSALVTCLQGCAIDDGERLGVKDDSIISHILQSRHQRNGSLMLLGHISRLFYTEDPNMLEAAIKCFPHIQPIDVLYLCQYHKVVMATVFKQYMLKMLEHLRTIHKPNIEECLFSHTEVRNTWLDILLQESFDVDKLKDSNGNPRPLSHKLDRDNSHLIEQVLYKLDIYKSRDLSDLLSLFFKYGYWNGVLLLLKHIKHVEEHFRVILYLKDIELLSDTHTLGYLPCTVKEWEFVLSTFKESTEAGIQEQDLSTSDWSSLVTWNTLAILLVRNLGPEIALSLLEKCDVGEGQLNAEFYHTCLLSSIVHKHKRSILHSMLEKVDMYLWSQRPAVVTPQLHYLLVSEKRVKFESRDDGTIHGDETVHSLTTILKDDRLVQPTPFMEDPDCHWGVKSKLHLHCGSCNIPLKEVVSHTEPGVMLFRCGHGYHKLCLPDRECCLCDEMSI